MHSLRNVLASAIAVCIINPASAQAGETSQEVRFICDQEKQRFSIVKSVRSGSSNQINYNGELRTENAFTEICKLKIAVFKVQYDKNKPVFVRRGPYYDADHKLPDEYEISPATAQALIFFKGN